MEATTMSKSGRRRMDAERCTVKLIVDGSALGRKLRSELCELEATTA
jgi:hypothetical protein